MNKLALLLICSLFLAIAAIPWNFTTKCALAEKVCGAVLDLQFS